MSLGAVLFVGHEAHRGINSVTEAEAMVVRSFQVRTHIMDCLAELEKPETPQRRARISNLSQSINDIVRDIGQKRRAASLLAATDDTERRFILRTMADYNAGLLAERTRTTGETIVDAKNRVKLSTLVAVGLFIGVGITLVQKAYDDDVKNRAIEERDERYRNLFRVIPIGMISGAWDEEAQEIVVVGWNESAEQLFGYTESEAINKRVSELMPQHYRHSHRQGVINHQKAGARPFTRTDFTQLEGLHRSGKTFPIMLRLVGWNDAVTGRNFYTAIVLAD